MEETRKELFPFSYSTPTFPQVVYDLSLPAKMTTSWLYLESTRSLYILPTLSLFTFHSAPFLTGPLYFSSVLLELTVSSAFSKCIQAAVILLISVSLYGDNFSELHFRIKSDLG